MDIQETSGAIFILGMHLTEEVWFSFGVSLVSYADEVQLGTGWNIRWSGGA